MSPSHRRASAPPSPRRPPRARTLLAALGLLVIPGCDDLAPGAGGLAGEIAEHRALWEKARPAAYVYQVERVCFCAPDGRGPVRVHVLGTEPLQRFYTSTGAPVGEHLKPVFPSVDGLFDLLEDAVAGGAFQVQITWDPATGIPLDFWVDYDRNVADEEQGYRVVALPRAEPAD